jgi:hypothetical protein
MVLIPLCYSATIVVDRLAPTPTTSNHRMKEIVQHGVRILDSARTPSQSSLLPSQCPIYMRANVVVNGGPPR